MIIDERMASPAPGIPIDNGELVVWAIHVGHRSTGYET
ncbi:hypothetical protein GA0115256_11028 [Streptomyces sp. DconLS]|nr:hypothetical protein GA0115258_100751 [Streptomyces sp. LamerLS-31b]SCF66268.1 hypothetical protein GA0115256_11028 [Streptomyces sp. DconLS]